MIRFVRPSKTVTDGQKIAASLEAASFEIAEDVGTALEATFAPWVEEGETPPAFEELRQILLGRWLRRVRERLVAADEAHQKEVRKERRLRRTRNEKTSEIREKVRRVRRNFEEIYGRGLSAEVVGLASDIPEDPVVLERYAQRVIDEMTDPDLSLPEPAVGGGFVHPEKVTEEIEPPLEVLRRVLKEHEPQKRQTQLALQEKREALEAFKYAVGRIARYLEALCYLAGKDFHAERVRQSSRVSPVEEGGPSQPADGGEDGTEVEDEAEAETETEATETPSDSP